MSLCVIQGYEKARSRIRQRNKDVNGSGFNCDRVGFSQQQADLLDVFGKLFSLLFAFSFLFLSCLFDVHFQHLFKIQTKFQAIKS